MYPRKVQNLIFEQDILYNSHKFINDIFDSANKTIEYLNISEYKPCKFKRYSYGRYGKFFYY